MLGWLLLSVEARAKIDREGTIPATFESKWIVLLGRISYSVYLYQQIFHAIKAEYPPYYAPLFAVPPLILGYLSCKLVEQPARSYLNRIWGHRERNKQT